MAVEEAPGGEKFQTKSVNALSEKDIQNHNPDHETQLEAFEGKQMAKEDPRSAPSTFNDHVWTEEPNADERYPNSRKLRDLVRRGIRSSHASSNPIPDREQPRDHAPDIPPPPAPHAAVRPPIPSKGPQSPTQQHMDEHILTHLPVPKAV